MRNTNEITTVEKIIADLTQREKIGLIKYGHYVHESKDDMLQHLYEELLDASCYIKTEIEQRKLSLEEVYEEVDNRYKETLL